MISTLTVVVKYFAAHLLTGLNDVRRYFQIPVLVIGLELWDIGKQEGLCVFINILC